jgi:hypothetical protein
LSAYQQVSLLPFLTPSFACANNNTESSLQELSLKGTIWAATMVDESIGASYPGRIQEQFPIVVKFESVLLSFFANFFGEMPRYQFALCDHLARVLNNTFLWGKILERP